MLCGRQHSRVFKSTTDVYDDVVLKNKLNVLKTSLWCRLRGVSVCYPDEEAHVCGWCRFSEAVSHEGAVPALPAPSAKISPYPVSSISVS